MSGQDTVVKRKRIGKSLNVTEDRPRHATQEEAAEFMLDFHTRVIAPNVNEIATIVESEDVAIILWNVSAELSKSFGQAGPVGVVIARGTQEWVEGFAATLVRTCPADPAVAWLRERKPGRVFAFIGKGTLCFDIVEGQGLVHVRGTSDHEWMS